MPQKSHSALELRIPFFRPMWRRVATVLVVFGWAIFEALAGSPWWALLMLGIGAYAAWVFFVTFEGTPSRGEER